MSSEPILNEFSLKAMQNYSILSKSHLVTLHGSVCTYARWSGEFNMH